MWQFENEQPGDAALRESLAKKSGNTGGASDRRRSRSVGHQKQFEDFLAGCEQWTEACD